MPVIEMDLRPEKLGVKDYPVEGLTSDQVLDALVKLSTESISISIPPAERADKTDDILGIVAQIRDKRIADLGKEPIAQEKPEEVRAA